jgi:DHA1 family tetracycline resistance protein-like MFS transporter
MKNTRLLTIFLIVFVDLLGFGLILPLLPFYADEYGATPVVVGLLTASYAAAQLIGAPILGRLSDRFGRRPVLLTSIFGTFLGFLLLGLAEPLGVGIVDLLPQNLLGEDPIGVRNGLIITILFISRILDGLTGGNISVAQAYITDITDESNRAQGLGLVGAAFGLGFIFGPAIGGALSEFGFAVPAYVAAALAGINIAAVAVFLPESLSIEERRAAAAEERPSFSARALWDALNRPRVGPLFNIRFFYGMAFSTFQTIFPLFAQYQLGLNARSTGFVLTYVGFLAVLVQGFLIGRLTKRYRDRQLILFGSVTLTFTLLAWGFTPNVPFLLVILAPLSLAAAILNVVINTALTKSVYPEEVGGTLGLSTSIESLTRAIAPSIGGALLGQFGAWAPGILSTAFMAWVVVYAWQRLIRNPDPPLEIRTAD